MDRQRDGYQEIDNRPQSMVYVEGGDVHAFFNFLLNYPSCIASSGPQHGLPPTLLSPVPFVGGSIVQNAVSFFFITRFSTIFFSPFALTIFGSKLVLVSHMAEIWAKKKVCLVVGKISFFLFLIYYFKGSEKFKLPLKF